LARFPATGVYPNQADGNLASPWVVYPDGSVLPVVVNNVATSPDGLSHAAYTSQGIGTSTLWKVCFWVIATDVVSAGGVNISCTDAVGNGWRMFIGNACHIYKLTGGAGGFLTNVARTYTGAPQYVEFIHNETTGVRAIYLDGVFHSSYTDTQYDGGNTIIWTQSNLVHPTAPMPQVWGLFMEDNNTVLGTGPGAPTGPAFLFPDQTPVWRRTMALR
jgi:hypothetical protein